MQVGYDNKIELLMKLKLLGGNFHSSDELDRKRSKSDRTILFRSDCQSLSTLKANSLFDLIVNLFFCDLDWKKIEFSQSFFALEVGTFFHF